MINTAQQAAVIFNDDDMIMSPEETYFRVFELDLLNSNTSAKYKTISDGEKQFTRFAVDFISLFNNNSYSKLVIALADEIENHMHPKWKKEILFHIIDIAKTFISIVGNNMNVHIILSTHSPFLLSDIPKGNIIFLNTYKEDDVEVKSGTQKIGNCKVVNGLKEKKQTFGANIHTLLSDSFFMEDGLMGEFAKNKINDVYNFIVNHKTDKIKTKKDAQDIINIIGEPLIQKELQELFDKKFELSNMSIDDEITVLERKLDALKKIKNDTD